jgi:hypothetical protein
VCGDEPPELAPVLAVGGEADVRRPVEQGVGDLGRRPRGDGVVVHPQDQLRRARGRHDQARDGAEAEEHEAAAAVLRVEAAEGDVWAVADVVQVADDGQARRRRGKATLRLLLLAAMAASGDGVPQQQEERDEEELC